MTANDETSQDVETKRRTRKSTVGPATRAKILDAAIQCIVEHGYHGTTTLMVQSRAGVSRGSLLHQFPTKADLMVAVSEHIIAGRRETYHAAWKTARGYRHRFELQLEILWAEYRKPGGLARLEILVAAISDPELMKRFEPGNTAMEIRFRNRAFEFAQHLGVTDEEGVHVLVTQFTAALRGLALNLQFPNLAAETEAAFYNIKQAHMDGLDRLIDKAKREARPPALRA